MHKAVAAGAVGAKDRDKFLDILATAIEDSYEPEGVSAYHHAKAQPKNAHLTPDQDAKLLAEMKAKARLKGMHIVQRISRHMVLPKLDDVGVAQEQAHDGAAAVPPAASHAPAASHDITASAKAGNAGSEAQHAPTSAPAAVTHAQDRQASVSHADTHSTARAQDAVTPQAVAQPAPQGHATAPDQATVDPPTPSTRSCSGKLMLGY